MQNKNVEVIQAEEVINQEIPMDFRNTGLMVIPKEEKSFAQGMNFYKIFWVFFIGCIFGVVVEMLFCLFTEHKIESRQGLIFGPFNPVYGGGAVVITMVAEWAGSRDKLQIFGIGALMGGAFEIFCSLVQELAFGARSWNYDGQLGSLAGGRTNVFYCVFWGLLTLLWIKIIYPRMSRWIERIPNETGKSVTYFLIIFMIINSIVTVAALHRAGERYHNIPPKTKVGEFIDKAFNDDLMNFIYPNYDYDNDFSFDKKKDKEKFIDEDWSIENKPKSLPGAHGGSG